MSQCRCHSVDVTLNFIRHFQSIETTSCNDRFSLSDDKVGDALFTSYPHFCGRRMAPSEPVDLADSLTAVRTDYSQPSGKDRTDVWLELAVREYRCHIHITSSVPSPLPPNPLLEPTSQNPRTSSAQTWPQKPPPTPLSRTISQTPSPQEPDDIFEK